ncbi:MAG TPA: YjbQ family protein [Caldithrix abyssi]|uniref:YjbQ family protein n=1 Tax=Caldithrix abyssi TaxID=187145 RepID=A0A7V5RQA6_CALAY|nr:YjbQ family protein [Caldithrix abyssi]
MEKFTVKTRRRTEFVEITSEVAQILAEGGIKDGSVIVFIPHTTAGITINENADPDVQRDMIFEMNKVIPFEDGYHHFEGNSAAHIKASLFGSSVTLIVSDGSMCLGRWQGIYLCEFDGPRTREVWVKISPDIKP